MRRWRVAPTWANQCRTVLLVLSWVLPSRAVLDCARCDAFCNPWTCKQRECLGCNDLGTVQCIGSPPAPPAAALGTVSTAGMLLNGWWGAGDRVLRRRFDRESTIAVVASSGNLLFQGFGPEIDAHSVVVRVNGPVLAGYEFDVGRRTDVRVAWAAGLADARANNVIDEHDETVILTKPGLDRSFRGPVGTPLDRKLQHLAVLSNEWGAKLSQELLAGRGWPSTGFQALALAVAMAQLLGAPPPTAYGFGACANCVKFYDCDGSNSSDHGGLQEEGCGQNGMHAFAEERAVRKAWHSVNLIQLVEPTCDRIGLSALNQPYRIPLPTIPPQPAAPAPRAPSCQPPHPPQPPAPSPSLPLGPLRSPPSPRPLRSSPSPRSLLPPAPLALLPIYAPSPTLQATQLPSSVATVPRSARPSASRADSAVTPPAPQSDGADSLVRTLSLVSFVVIMAVVATWVCVLDCSDNVSGAGCRTRRTALRLRNSHRRELLPTLEHASEARPRI